MVELSNKTDEAQLWEQVRSQFNYSKDFIHLGSSQFLVSHPRFLNRVIDQYRRLIDDNPVLYTEENEDTNMDKVRKAAAAYLEINKPETIAITDSTTMGLGLIYTALNIKTGKEILTTEHDHYAHHESIFQATARSGGGFRKVALYKNVSQTTEEEIVSSLLHAIDEKVRVIGITWVHSDSGLKLPVPAISRAIKKMNKGRKEAEKILLVVDGVHGLGIEKENFEELGADFFISGCHKWLYGPRGTGIIAATEEAWQCTSPVIPSFTEVMDRVIKKESRPSRNNGKQMTPGGFHSLEYRWSLCEAFEWMLHIGKERVYQRIHHLNRICKEGLASIPQVLLHTPLSDELSAGIVSFEIKGMSTEKAVEKLREKKVVATAAPYKKSWIRFTPGIINTEEEISRALNVVNDLK